MPKKKKTTKAKAPKKAKAKKESAQKTLSPEEQKMEIIGAYLEEIFHLIGHSVEAGTEADTPLHEILHAAMAVHNQIEEDQDHTIRGITILCGCNAKEHRLEPKTYVHHC